MVPILSLAEHLLARGRRLRSAGFFHEAVKPLEKMLTLPGQNTSISAENRCHAGRNGRCGGKLSCLSGKRPKPH